MISQLESKLPVEYCWRLKFSFYSLSTPWADTIATSLCLTQYIQESVLLKPSQNNHLCFRRMLKATQTFKGHCKKHCIKNTVDRFIVGNSLYPRSLNKDGNTHVYAYTHTYIQRYIYTHMYTEVHAQVHTHYFCLILEKPASWGTTRCFGDSCPTQ